MNTFEGIEITLKFGDMVKQGSYTFTKFSSEEFLDFIQEICEEFIKDIEME